MDQDKKTIEKLKDLLELANFNEFIKLQRSKINIPTNGFDKNNTYEKTVKDEDKFYDGLEKTVTQVLDKFKLSKTMRPAIENLIMGDVSLDINESKQTVYCAEVDYDGFMNREYKKRKPSDYISIRIYPGASQRDVISLLRENWEFINKLLKNRFPKKYQKRIKVRKKRNRDVIIYNMYNDGVVNYDGTVNNEKVKKYLNKLGIKNYTTVFEGLTQAKIDFPNTPEARRKIIQNYKRKNKK